MRLCRNESWSIDGVMTVGKSCKSPVHHRHSPSRSAKRATVIRAATPPNYLFIASVSR
ncbi:hypothetical protein AHF37_12758 [Paragonimus kellicotti]|nr:hypothetical protein AHF37_12758 [Paragonimus kellicotti]